MARPACAIRHAHEPSASAVALMVLATLLWSIAGVVTRHLDAARSFEVTFWRSLFNALTLLVVLLPLRGTALFRDILAGRRVIWFSGLCWATMYTAFMVALTLTSVANVLVAMATGPLLTALAARLFLGDRLPARTWAAIGVAGLGIAWMFGAEAMQRRLAARQPGGAGRAAGLLGQLHAAAAPGAARARRWRAPGHAAGGAARRHALGRRHPAAGLAAAGLRPRHRPAWRCSASVQLAIPCLLVVRLSRELPATELALLALLEVIFGVLLAWLGANEIPSDSTLAGGALVLAALAANHLAGRR
jgi:drug/metabolite transporter (DMT)-like permease